MKTIKPTKDNIGRLWFQLPCTSDRVVLDIPDWRNWTLWKTRAKTKRNIIFLVKNETMIDVGHDYHVLNDQITIRTELRVVVAVLKNQPNIPLKCGHDVVPGSRFCSWCGTPAVNLKFA